MTKKANNNYSGLAFVAGLRQVVKGLKENRITRVTVALNADENIKNQISEMCQNNKIPVSYVRSKEELGREMGLEVGCSVTGELKQ